MPHLSVGREYAAMAAVVVAQGLVCWHFASQSFFFSDDFVLFQDALAGGLNSSYLASEAILHFTPGNRLVTLLIQRHATLDFNVALGFLLVLHSLGVALLQRILRLLFGTPWWVYALPFAYGISIIVLPSLEWYASGVLVIPAATFGLAAIHAHLCWRRTGRAAWLVWSLVATGAALLFYEKALLVPVYLLLMRLLLLEPRTSLREAARAVVREWRVWALYGLVIAGYLAAYLARTHHEPWRTPPFDTVLVYLRTTWLDGLVPALLGLRVTAQSGSFVSTWAVVACQLVLVALVALSVLRRRFAWRAWLFFGLAFALNAAVLLPRVAAFPADIGYTPRYNVELAFLFPIVLAFAFAGPPDPEGAVPPSPGRPGPATAIAAALVLGAYVGLSWAAAADITRDGAGKFSRRWVDNIRSDVGVLRGTGVRPVLLDDHVPDRVLPGWIKLGAASLSRTLPVFLDGLRFDRVSGNTFRVRPDGHLEPVAFRPATGGDPRRLYRQGQLTISGIGPGAFARTGCIDTASGPAKVELRPPHALHGQRWYLVSRYRSDPRPALFLEVDRGVGYPAVSDLGLAPKRRTGSGLTALGALPTGTPTFAGMRFDIPRGHWACVDRLVVGSYVGRRAAAAG